MQRGAILASASFSRQHDAKLKLASVFYLYWRDAEFILASAFSCPDLNAGPEPRVMAPSRRDPRVCDSRICYSCDANPASAIPAFVIPVSVILATLTPASANPRVSLSKPASHFPNPRLTFQTRVSLCTLSFHMLLSLGFSLFLSPLHFLSPHKYILFYGAYASSMDSRLFGSPVI